ncbi:MAG: F0F1 ATP synthase subunit epsilon [Actinomycetota bacterium]|nr:F0F1 ATP synthase subunit epsilon [Actinomycetota bacterium]
MSDDQLQVELVSAERTVWSGQAQMVLARTTEGDLGVLRNHTPILSLLVDGVVEITPVDGEHVVAAVDGGFISVAANRVSILSAHAVLAEDIDADHERNELEEAEKAGDDEEDGQEGAQARARRAEARIRATERAS